MSYVSTNNKLVGKFRVRDHAVDRYKERYGEEYIGNKKIKNMNENKARRKIRKSLRDRRKFISENDDGTVYVETKDFGAIVDPKYHNDVVTII